MLARIDEEVFVLRPQLGEERCRLDQLRPSADDRDDLKRSAARAQEEARSGR
jgi:hypothetical protein